MRIGKTNRVGAAAMAVAAVFFGMGKQATGSGLQPAGVLGHAGVMSSAMTGLGQSYVLHLHHLHTDESLDIVYRIGNVYLPDAMETLNVFLRDHRTQAEADYDPKEFDLLHALMARLGRSNGVIDIACGYRTPWSNNFLRTRSASTGVAEHSQHMLAKAMSTFAFRA